MPLTIRVVPHPLLEIGAFTTQLAAPLASIRTPDAIRALAMPGATAPLAPSDAIKTAVRDLLRHGGFKPSGRSKPASEYLTAAVADGRWPWINPLVDACNVVSLHAGLPISLVDLDKARGALAVRIAPPQTTYVFNPSGQVIDASGLVCLYDDDGPTGTPVKDAQRTKTDDTTQHALAIVWGTSALPGRTAAATRWYRELVTELGSIATLDDVSVVSS